MNNLPQYTRRRFVKQTAASMEALSFPYFVPGSALGLGYQAAPSDRITMGVIGTGGRGQDLIKMFLKQPDAQILAVCDVDAKNREKGRTLVNGQYGNEDCKIYNDFRELVARPDIGAVIVATPDHWLAPVMRRPWSL